LEPISYGCLKRFVHSTVVVVLEKRETIKSGSKGEGATWPWAETPKEVWSLMEQTWAVVGVHTNARIEAKGCIVPDENF
jgi:hypothetical protein